MHLGVGRGRFHGTMAQDIGYPFEVRALLMGGARPSAERFFLSERGTALAYSTVHAVFSRLRRTLAHHGHPPRLHDLRHTHACRVLQRWQASRRGAEGRLLILSRYLGHHHLRDTYWYLHALPELLAVAGKRFERATNEKP